MDMDKGFSNVSKVGESKRTGTDSSTSNLKKKTDMKLEVQCYNQKKTHMHTEGKQSAGHRLRKYQWVGNRL